MASIYKDVNQIIDERYGISHVISCVYDGSSQRFVNAVDKIKNNYCSRHQ